MGRPELAVQILAEFAELRRGQDELRRGQDELRELVRGLQQGRAGLDAGRNKAILRAKQCAAQNRETVRVIAELDEKSRRPPRGRAKRIALSLPKKPNGRPILSESHIQKILRALSSVRDPLEQTGDVDDWEK